MNKNQLGVPSLISICVRRRKAPLAESASSH